MLKQLFFFAVCLASVRAETLLELANATSPTLVSAIATAAATETWAQNVVTLLSSPGNSTVFLPSEDAVLSFVGESMWTVEDVILYHVVDGRVLAADLTEGYMGYETLDGRDILIGRMGNDVRLFSGYGKNPDVTIPNVEGSNGVAHVINAVLVPPASAAPTAAYAGLDALVDALLLADLVTAVEGMENVTVFAPTNEAFTAFIGEKNFTSEEVKAVLLNHVVEANAYSWTLNDGDKVDSLGELEIEVSLAADGAVMVNDVDVVIPDVIISNGVVHVIDKVLTSSALSAGVSTLVVFVCSALATLSM